MMVKKYMNVKTGSVSNHSGWWYEDQNGKLVNAVDKGEVVEVVRDKKTKNWKQVL